MSTWRPPCVLQYHNWSEVSSIRQRAVTPFGKTSVIRALIPGEPLAPPISSTTSARVGDTTEKPTEGDRVGMRHGTDGRGSNPFCPYVHEP